MKTRKAIRASRPGKKSRSAPPAVRYVLRLFVAGASTRSREAMLRIQQLCQHGIPGGCDLKVIDIYQQPKLARAHQIVATPTLIVEFPPPVRRLIGNLANFAGQFAGPNAVIHTKIAV